MPGPGLALIIPPSPSSPLVAGAGALSPLGLTAAAAAATATQGAIAQAAALADATAWAEELAELETSIDEQTTAQAALALVNPAAAVAMSLQIVTMQKQALRLAAHQLHAQEVASFLTQHVLYLDSLVAFNTALAAWATADTM